MTIVKATNKIALFSVIALIYWVFILVCSTVFGFKVFQENITELFFMSIFGLFAVLFGAIILNIMFNLTSIAQSRDVSPNKEINKSKWATLFAGSLIIVFSVLYLGDNLTKKKKKTQMLNAASALISEQNEIIERLTEYNFSRDYLERTREDIMLLSKVEEKFPRVTVIVQDDIKGKPYLLGFNQYSHVKEKQNMVRAEHILSTSESEREYLFDVLGGVSNEHYFSSNGRHYEIYYPVSTNKGTIVLHLSAYNRYGKIGS